MWDELDKLTSPRSRTFVQLNVVGPPGTGKSMVAWAWTCFTSCQKLNKNILWIHLNKGDNSIYLCHFRDGKMMTYQEGRNQFAATIKNIDADVMVVDGVTNKEYDSFSSSATSWRLEDASKKRRVAFIMSASVVISSQHLKIARIKQWHMPSWAWDNYVAVCDNDEFYRQVKSFLPNKTGYTRKDLLASKFFLAGSSARWMFSFKYSELEGEIKKHLSRVTNKEWILSDVSGNNCAGAVGHLRFEDRDKNVSFVSRYVMIAVAKTCELRFIKDAYPFTATHRNPAFKGWIVEFDFLGQLHQALRHKSKVVVSTQNKENHLSVREIQYIDPDGDLQHLSKRAGLWLIPIRWNQGGYDAIYIKNENTVIFVQITCSKRHDLKLHHMQNLWNKLHPSERSSRRSTQAKVADVWFV